MQKIVASIIDNIEKVLIGKRPVVTLSVVTLLCEGHLLLEDVPGVGKTTLADALARSVNGTLNRISFTPDVLPSDITGFYTYNRKTSEFEFKTGAAHCNFLLADEINRTTPKTQSSLLEAMQEQSVTVDSVKYELPSPYMVLATQNPIEQMGTYPLPEAQLDRFFMKLTIGYPDAQSEANIILTKSAETLENTIKPVATTEDIINIQKYIKTIYMKDVLANYIVRLAQRTRTHPALTLGISPRACISLSRAAQAYAFLSNRDFVIPEDIKSAAIPVLSHRIILNKEARSRRMRPEQIITSILQETPIK